MPRGVRAKVLETAEMPVGQSDPRIMKATEKARDAMPAPSLVQVVEKPVDKEWADMIQFSREIVGIVVNESPDKNAENPVFCGNNGTMPITENGRPGWMYRGKEYKIERRFVESLARAKVTTYTQRRENTPNGDPIIVNVPHTACRYDFRITHDPNPLGQAWLKAILLEPA